MAKQLSNVFGPPNSSNRKFFGVFEQGYLALSNKTLRPSGYHAKAVTFGCMAKAKGVSSRASLLISVKVLVGNNVSSGHHAKAVSSG
jgi:hypothetical protein